MNQIIFHTQPKTLAPANLIPKTAPEQIYFCTLHINITAYIQSPLNNNNNFITLLSM